MKRTSLFICTSLLTSLILSSCGSVKKTSEPEKPLPPAYEKLKGCSWISGTWTNPSEEGILMEIWSLANDSVLKGESYFMIGKDTVHSEQITIEQRGGDVFYIPVIKTQNNGQPTLFKLTKSNNKEMIFENPEHDFPQKISYELKGDSLIAQVSGKTKEGEMKERFPMRKAK